MEQTKLISLLKTFNRSEWKQFRSQTREQAAGTDALLLLEYLDPLYPDFPRSKVDKSLVFKALFSAKAYKDQKMRHLINDLNFYAEQFLVSQSLASDSAASRFILLRQYRQRGLDKHFAQELKETGGILQEDERRDATHYYDQFLLETESNKFIKNKQRRDVEPNLQNVSDNLDIFYLINKLRVSCEAINYRNIVKIDYDIRMIDQLIAEIERGGYDHIPAITIYYTVWRMLSRADAETDFEKLKGLLFDHQHSFQKEELRDIQVYAKNFCIRRINKGDQKYIRALFDLYQLELLQVHSAEDFSPGMFKNIASVAFGLKELDWAKEFMDKYSGYLPADQRESLYSYNVARYHFEKKNYDQVTDLLSTVEYNDMFIMLGVKGLLLKTYFEQQEVSLFDSLLGSFKVLLRNKKLIGYHQKNYLNLIRYAEKLIRIDLRNKKQVKALRTEIESSTEIIDKDWLLKKLEVV